MTTEPPDSGKDDLQFDSAEAAGATPAGACAICQKPITTSYYEAGGQIVCTSCKDKVQDSNVSGVAAASFVRAGVFGVVGAAAGAGVYYAVLALTGYEVGLIAILVGFMVGYAVRLGAAGRGGRRYQLLALALTYLAIGSTYVPLVLRDVAGEGTGGADSVIFDPADSASVAPSAADTTGQPSFGGGLTLAVVVLFILALAMPILVVISDFPSSLISALIIGFALHQAWRMNGRVKIAFTGPFKVGATPAGGPSPGN